MESNCKICIKKTNLTYEIINMRRNLVFFHGKIVKNIAALAILYKKPRLFHLIFLQHPGVPRCNNAKGVMSRLYASGLFIVSLSPSLSWCKCLLNSNLHFLITFSAPFLNDLIYNTQLHIDRTVEHI